MHNMFVLYNFLVLCVIVFAWPFLSVFADGHGIGDKSEWFCGFEKDEGTCGIQRIGKWTVEKTINGGQFIPTGPQQGGARDTGLRFQFLTHTASAIGCSHFTSLLCSFVANAFTQHILLILCIL